MNPYKTYLQSKNYADNSIRHYLSYHKSYQNWLTETEQQAVDITYEKLLAYVLQLKTRVSPSTANKHLRGIELYYNHLNTSNNPAQLLRIKTHRTNPAHNILSQEELATIYNSYQPAGLLGKRNQLLLSLLIYQALSVRELEHLEVKDINLKAGTVYIQGSRKTNARKLKLEASQILIARDYLQNSRITILQEHPNPDLQKDYLIIAQGGSKHLNNSLKTVFSNLKKQYSKLKDRKQIRASVISHWLTQYDLRIVQYLAGHKYVSSTESYKVVEVRELQEELKTKHPMG
jgi:integrase/recombinase XerD